MIKLDAESLFREYRAATRARDAKLADFDRRAQSLVGPGASSTAAADKNNTVNHQGAYASVMLPRLVQNNPRAAVNTRRRGRSASNPSQTIDQHAFATKLFVDASVKTNKLGERLEFIGLDYLMKWGVALTTRKKHPGMSRSANQDVFLPVTERIPLYRVLIDPLCDDWHDARYLGHVWVADQDDLQTFAEDEDSGWDATAIKALESGGSLSDLGDRDEAETTERDEVVCVDFWFPENQIDPDLGPEDGFNGAIVTIALNAKQDKASIIRKPRPYFGPPEGPYEIFGCYHEYKTPYPLSPLTMTDGQEELLRSMVAAANRGALSYRKVVLVPAGTKTKEAAKLAAIQDHVIIEVAGLPADAKPIEIELGGVTDQQLKNVAYAERQLNLISGMDQAQQGEVTGDGTATEHAIAESSSQTRIGHVVNQFRKGVRAIMRRHAWYLWYDDEVGAAIGPDVEDTQEYEIPWVQGGVEGVDLQAFDLIDIDIEPMSMEHVTEELQKRRVLEAFQIMLQIVPLMRMYPEVQWKRWVGIIGDALNLPDLGSLVDMDVAERMAGIPGVESAGAGGQVNFGGERRDVVGRMTGGAMRVPGVA